eukprot:scaffold6064_cov173-Amphora_coffeaeformis.AAC.1
MPLWICILAAGIALLLLYRHAVRVQEKTRLQAVQAKSPSSVHMEDCSSSLEGSDYHVNEETSPREHQNVDQHQQSTATQQVLHQSFWYLMAFYVTHIMSTLNWATGDSFFVVLVFQSLLNPLQGFLNLIVYRRPVFLKYRRQEESRLRAWYLALQWSFMMDKHGSSSAPEQPQQQISQQTLEHRSRQASSRYDSSLGAQEGSSSSSPSSADFYSDKASSGTIETLSSIKWGIADSEAVSAWHPSNRRIREWEAANGIHSTNNASGVSKMADFKTSFGKSSFAMPVGSLTHSWGAATLG